MHDWGVILHHKQAKTTDRILCGTIPFHPKELMGQTMEHTMTQYTAAYTAVPYKAAAS